MQEILKEFQTNLTLISFYLDFQFLFVALKVKFASCASNSVLYPKREIYHMQGNKHPLLLMHWLKHVLFLGNFCICCLSFWDLNTILLLQFTILLYRSKFGRGREVSEYIQRTVMLTTAILSGKTVMLDFNCAHGFLAYSALSLFSHGYCWTS